MFMRGFVIAFLVGAAISSALAQTTNRQFTFPPVGLGSSETAEINLINVAANLSNGTAASCVGNVTFTNAAGTTLGTATPFTLTAGQVTTVRLPFASAGVSGTRTVIRALINETVPTATPRPPCALEISFQTFDTATGATHALLTGVSRVTGLH
jgi:hypothetical protein